LITEYIRNGLTIRIFNDFSLITHIEVKLAIRTENKGMNAMIVLDTFNATKQYFLFIGFVIPVGICKHKHMRTSGNNYPIIEHHNTKCSINIIALIEHFAGIRFTVTIDIL